MMKITTQDQADFLEKSHQASPARAANREFEIAQSEKTDCPTDEKGGIRENQPPEPYLRYGMCRARPLTIGGEQLPETAFAETRPETRVREVE